MTNKASQSIAGGFQQSPPPLDETTPKAFRTSTLGLMPSGGLTTSHKETKKQGNAIKHKGFS